MTLSQRGCYNEDLILTMDEALVQFDMFGKSTVHLKGDKNVIRIAGGEKNRLTVVLICSQSGIKLRPQIIFRVSESGSIAKKLSQQLEDAGINVDLRRRQYKFTHERGHHEGSLAPVLLQGANSKLRGYMDSHDQDNTDFVRNGGDGTGSNNDVTKITKD
ncbi:hypothetical protein HDU97_007212 [Phlyctochytrium planicorne]|nr:hypothetical protein HDU97_007212 [Phlyctochytrium planicorne]